MSDTEWHYSEGGHAAGITLRDTVFFRGIVGVSVGLTRAAGGGVDSAVRCTMPAEPGIRPVRRAASIADGVQALAAIGYAPPQDLVDRLAAFRGHCLIHHRQDETCWLPFGHAGEHVYT
jgi:hypothetical protein